MLSNIEDRPSELATPDLPSLAPPLPLRSCVGIVMVNRFGHVWLGRRTPKWFNDRNAAIWQLPQGGIIRNEPAQDAAIRELAEETAAESVEIIGEIAEPLTYELPPALLGIALKGRYRGQTLRWFAMRFNGNDSEIDVRAHKGRKAEFDAWRWARPQEALADAPSYKRPMYANVLARFSPLLG